MPKHLLRKLKLDAVVEGCQSESSRPRSEEMGYCFELFRRALEEQEQAAWSALDAQYKHLILHWIYNRSPGLSRDEIDEIAPDTLPKFWRILTRSSTPLADRFSHVGAILKYLKHCTISVLGDYERRLQRQERIRSKLESPEFLAAYQPETEVELLARIDQERMLQMVRRWMATYVTDPQEQQVVTLSFEIGLTPAQIARDYPQAFTDVKEVRRIKERLLKRAKRALSDTTVANSFGSPNGPVPEPESSGTNLRNVA